MFAVGYLIDELKEKYQEQTEIIAYLEAVQKDILENIDDFRQTEEESAPFPGRWRKETVGEIPCKFDRG